MKLYSENWHDLQFYFGLDRVWYTCSGSETFYSGLTTAPAAKLKLDMV